MAKRKAGKQEGREDIEVRHAAELLADDRFSWIMNRLPEENSWRIHEPFIPALRELGKFKEPFTIKRVAFRICRLQLNPPDAITAIRKFERDGREWLGEEGKPICDYCLEDTISSKEVFSGKARIFLDRLNPWTINFKTSCCKACAKWIEGFNDGFDRGHHMGFYVWWQLISGVLFLYGVINVVHFPSLGFTSVVAALLVWFGSAYIRDWGEKGV